MSTVFDSIVSKENDHTNLLRNILERHPRAAAGVLSYLLERDIPEEVAASLEYKTQHSFLSLDGREIPDILVEGPHFRCLIEAKIDPTLGLTEGQKRGYPSCFPNVGDCHLSFLVPHEWRHHGSVTQVRVALPRHISLHTSSWLGLIRRLEDITKSLADEVVKEAVEFWKWRFKFERMTPEERDSLSPWSGEKYSAIRKLEKVLIQTKQLFDARNFETELETSDIYGYGFYIKRGHTYILWIGIWDAAPTPLSFGFDIKGGNWLRPKKPPGAPSTAGGYNIWPLEPESWDDPERIYTTVNQFLQSYGPK